MKRYGIHDYEVEPVKSDQVNPGLMEHHHYFFVHPYMELTRAPEFAGA